MKKITKLVTALSLTATLLVATLSGCGKEETFVSNIEDISKLDCITLEGTLDKTTRFNEVYKYRFLIDKDDNMAFTIKPDYVYIPEEDRTDGGEGPYIMEESDDSIDNSFTLILYNDIMYYNVGASLYATQPDNELYPFHNTLRQVLAKPGRNWVSIDIKKLSDNINDEVDGQYEYILNPKDESVDKVIDMLEIIQDNFPSIFEGTEMKFNVENAEKSIDDLVKFVESDDFGKVLEKIRDIGPKAKDASDEMNVDEVKASAKGVAQLIAANKGEIVKEIGDSIDISASVKKDDGKYNVKFKLDDKGGVLGTHVARDYDMTITDDNPDIKAMIPDSQVEDVTDELIGRVEEFKEETNSSGPLVLE